MSPILCVGQVFCSDLMKDDIMFFLVFGSLCSYVSIVCRVKDKDYCPIEIIKGLTDKGQFQYLTKLMGPQKGTYLYETQFHSLR